MQDFDIIPTSSARVQLRRFQSSDLVAFQAYRQDLELSRFQGWEPWSDEQAQKFIDEMAEQELFCHGEWIQLAIIDITGEQLIGDIGIYISEDETESNIGYTLHREFHGRGLATEAVKLAVDLIFNHTKVENILAVTDRLNHASVRLIQRLGMTKMKSEETVFKGNPCIEDTYVLKKPVSGF